MSAPVLLCPLLAMSALNVAGAWNLNNLSVECLGEKCAWWVSPPGVCAVTAMARNMVIATRTMDNLFDEDPFFDEYEDRFAVCPDCGAVIPPDGNCWYCEEDRRRGDGDE